MELENESDFRAGTSEGISNKINKYLCWGIGLDMKKLVVVVGILYYFL